MGATGALVLCVVASASSYNVELTHLINKDTIYWETGGKFILTPLIRQTHPYWVATNKFSTYEHGGTHIDAPYHFNSEGWKLDQIPLKRLFMVPGILINKTEEAKQNPEYELSVQDIFDWEEENGPLPNPCVVLITFGWFTRYSDRRSYLGIRGENDFDRHFPGVSGEASRWFVESGKVYGVGVDSASPDDIGHIAHITLTAANLYILENLNFAHACNLPARDFKVVILPMKIEKGTGGPANIVLEIHKEVTHC